MQHTTHAAASTATFGRQDELVSSRLDVPTDPLLADSLIARRIDKVDASIQDRIEHRIGVFLAHNPHALGPRSTNSHAPIAELRDFRTSPSTFLREHLFLGIFQHTTENEKSVAER